MRKEKLEFIQDTCFSSNHLQLNETKILKYKSTKPGRPVGYFGIGPCVKDENRTQNRPQIGPKIGLIFQKYVENRPHLKKMSILVQNLSGKSI